MSDLPPGWEWATLGEVADVVGGITKDAKRQADPDLPEVPYLRVANVQNCYLDLSVVKTIRAPLHKVQQLALRPGDVLLNEGGDRDKLARGWVWQGQLPLCIHQNHVFRARIRGAVLDPRILAWHCNEFGQRWAEVNGTQSVNLASISLSTIRQMPVPIPPRSEQERIASSLEQHLSGLRSATETLTAARRRATFVVGRYVDDHLSELGPIRPLGKCIRQPMRNGYSGPSVREPNGVRTLTLTAVTKQEFVDKNTKFTDIRNRRIDDLWLMPGDILVQRANTPELVGTSALYSGPERWAIFPDLVIRVRTSAELLPAFAQLVLQAPSIRAGIKRSAKGLAGTMPKIDQQSLMHLSIPVPDLFQQRQFIDDTARLIDNVRRLTEALTSGLRRGAALRSSLFADAFAGRLVPQNPTDEPASVLLERIRAERAAAPKPKRARRGPRPDPAQETLS